MFIFFDVLLFEKQSCNVYVCRGKVAVVAFSVYVVPALAEWLWVNLLGGRGNYVQKFACTVVAKPAFVLLEPL